MTILIIGSKGFIGKSCKAYFLKKKHVVLGCDIAGKNEDGYYFVDPLDPDFEKVIAVARPDVCINASGSADVGFSIKNPEMDLKLNVKNVERILEAIRKHSPACKFVNFSSAAVYGNPRSLPVSEEAVTEPLSPYGRHKLQSERLLKEYTGKYDLKTCSLRVFSAYGVGLRKQLFWDIYQKALLGKKVTLFGTGNESRDFIFIDDLVRAIDVIISNAKFQGEAINVSSGVETSIKDAARIFLSFLNQGHELAFSGEEKKGDPKNWKADISTLKGMGFNPFVTFEEGVKKYAEWLKEEK